ncbi:iron-sulfur clusters transporter ATM1, mitochondrial [Arthrobacter sp. Hiyo8]|nr:iron-sulfur clusters transporter ATM1, mitochondrial [Arthrobacter sp. Hiyo8]
MRGEVRFEGVRFAYDGGTDVLLDVDLTLPAGTSTAIVGPTGSGKSTLGSLVRACMTPPPGGSPLTASTCATSPLRT